MYIETRALKYFLEVIYSVRILLKCHYFRCSMSGHIWERKVSPYFLSFLQSIKGSRHRRSVSPQHIQHYVPYVACLVQVGVVSVWVFITARSITNFLIGRPTTRLFVKT